VREDGAAVVRVEVCRVLPNAEQGRRAEAAIREAADAALKRLDYQLSPAPTILGSLHGFLREQRLVRGNTPAVLKFHERALHMWAAELGGQYGGDIAVDRIRSGDVLDVVERLIAGKVDGRRKGASTVNQYLGSLKQLGRWATRGSGRRQIALDMPWLEMGRLRAPKPQRYAMDLRDFGKLMRRWPRARRHVAQVVWMVLMTGARPGQMLELKWRDIRRARKGEPGWIRLRASKGGTLEAIRFEVGSPIDDVIEAAREWFREVRGRVPRHYERVFVTVHGRRPGWSVQGFANAVRECVRVATRAQRCRREDGFSAYIARHSVLTWLARANVPEDIRAQFAGHRSTRMQEHYTHLSGEDAGEARALVQDAVRLDMRASLRLRDCDAA
jgi:integrase